MLKAARDGLVRSASTTGSCSTTDRRRSRSSSRGGGLSALPSCGWRATCSRISRRTASTSASPARRMAAFGLDPAAHATPRSWPSPTNGLNAEAVRQRLATELDALAVAVRLDRPARPRGLPRRGRTRTRPCSGSRSAWPGTAPSWRLGIGRPARGRELGRSLLEAQGGARHDRGQRRLLPRPRLARAPAEPSGRAARGVRRPRARPGRAELAGCSTRSPGCSTPGCRWSEAAERLGVHRHTLRYRMDRLREATGRHPDDPEQRMELWLALKAHDALAARRGAAAP